MTRAANLAKIVTDANLEGTVDVAGAFTSLGIDDNADANAITIDSSEQIGIGTTAPSQLLHLKSTTNAKPNLLIETENAGANGGRLDFLHKSSSPADGDLLGDITFGGYSDDGTPPSDFARYVMMKAFASDVSNNAEKGKLVFSLHDGASNENNVDVVTIDGQAVSMSSTLAVTGALSAKGGAVFNEDSADVDFRVESNGNANMLFVDGGNNTVHIGQSVPDTTLSGGTPPFQITGSGFGATSAIVRREASSFGPSLMLAKSRNTAVGSHTIVQSGDRLGGIIFIGDDGTDLDTYGATITADCDGTPGANDMPGRLVFSTTADGANSPTERMRIHNGGVVSIPQGIALGVGTANTASNVISDYEEGTWTPTLFNGSSALGSADINATYTKIGRMVYLEFRIQRDDTSSDTNTIQIGGLPFTSRNGFRMAGQAWIDNSSSDIRCYIYLGASTTTATLIKAGDTDAFPSFNEFTNARYIIGQIIYNT